MKRLALGLLLAVFAYAAMTPVVRIDQTNAAVDWQRRYEQLEDQFRQTPTCRFWVKARPV